MLSLRIVIGPDCFFVVFYFVPLIEHEIEDGHTITRTTYEHPIRP